MRTTLNLDDDVMRSVRLHAAETGQTMTQIVEEAIREKLAQRAQEQGIYELEWPTVRGRLLPGVDLSDRDSLFDAMERRSDRG